MNILLEELINKKEPFIVITNAGSEKIQTELSSELKTVQWSEHIGTLLHNTFVKKETFIPDIIFLCCPLKDLDREAYILLTKYALQQCIMLFCNQPLPLASVKENLIHNIITSMNSDIMFYNYTLYNERKAQLQDTLEQKILLVEL